jgi:3-hydroxyisobutyrate dehydrogenase-like beta-hydroxyacid dehydrogenase
LEREFTEDFSLASAHKDVENIRQLAEDHEAALPVVNAMVVIYEAAIQMGMGEEAKSAMIKVYERRFEQTVERCAGSVSKSD